MTASPDPIVRLDGGRFGYGGRAVVEATFGLDRGEVVAVIGPNGSGKTTLVKGVLGLVEQLGGTLELFGVPARTFTERYRLGYVPQTQGTDGPLTATVDEVVTSGRLARKRRFRPIGPADRAAVARALDTVGLADRARVPIADLSGGQHRRALIARALASEAEVLVLDEPLAGMDRASRSELAATLERLVDAGTTIVTVLHELGPLAPLLTRVVWLTDGRVVFDGDPAGVQAELGHDDEDPHGGEPERTGLGFQR